MSQFGIKPIKKNGVLVVIFAKRRWACRVIERMGLSFFSKEGIWIVSQLIWGAKQIRKQSGWHARKGVLKAAATMADNPSAIRSFYREIAVDKGEAILWLLRVRSAALELAAEYKFYDLLAALKSLGISGPEMAAEHAFNELLAAVKRLGISLRELAVTTDSIELPPERRGLHMSELTVEAEPIECSAQLRGYCISALELAVWAESLEFSVAMKSLDPRISEPKLPVGYAFYTLLAVLKRKGVSIPELAAEHGFHELHAAVKSLGISN